MGVTSSIVHELHHPAIFGTVTMETPSKTTSRNMAPLAHLSPMPCNTAEVAHGSAEVAVLGPAVSNQVQIYIYII